MPEQRSVFLSDTAGMMRLLNLSTGNIAINEETVLGVTALWRAITLLAGAVAGLPVTVFRTQPNGDIRLLDDHPAHRLINIEPNAEQIPALFWFSMVANAMLRGGAGAEIIRDDMGNPAALRLMRYGCTPYKLSKHDPLRYYDNEDGSLFFPEDVFYMPGIMVLNGSQPLPIVHYFQKIFGEELAAQLLMKTLSESGPYPAAVYTFTGKLTDLAKQNIQNTFTNEFGGVGNAGKIIPIDNGSNFTQLQPVNLQQSQRIESRKFTVADVARITGVSADMLEETEKQSYSFSEQSSKRFFLFTLDPWLLKRDQEAEKKLLRDKEKGRIRIETRVDETLWMLPKDRADYWNKLFQMGAKSPNEIRRYNHENAVPGGDELFVQQNLIPLSLVKKHFQNQSQPAATGDGTDEATEDETEVPNAAGSDAA